MTPELSPAAAWFSTAGTALVLIFLAELGDKTQLVCMTLAAKHRPWPVIIGAVLSFILLNVLAVAFGASLSKWLPENLLVGIVAVLFAVFGIQFLRDSGDDEEEETETLENGGKSVGRSVILTTFMLIFVAELGDKTQIAVAGLAAGAPPIPVWVGSTLALSLSSVLGVVVGRTLLTRIPMKTLNRVSGLFFLTLAALALTQLKL